MKRLSLTHRHQLCNDGRPINVERVPSVLLYDSGPTEKPNDTSAGPDPYWSRGDDIQQNEALRRFMIARRE
jgi:hypothetical protein